MVKRVLSVGDLEPAAMQVWCYLLQAGHVDAIDALINLGGMSSASLARRITDLTRAGVPIYRQQRVNPISGREYTRYVLLGPADA